MIRRAWAEAKFARGVFQKVANRAVTPEQGAELLMPVSRLGWTLAIGDAVARKPRTVKSLYLLLFRYWDDRKPVYYAGCIGALMRGDAEREAAGPGGQGPYRVAGETEKDEPEKVEEKPTPPAERLEAPLYLTYVEKVVLWVVIRTSLMGAGGYLMASAPGSDRFVQNFGLAQLCLFLAFALSRPPKR